MSDLIKLADRRQIEVAKPHFFLRMKTALSPYELDLLTLMTWKVAASADAQRFKDGELDPDSEVDIAKVAISHRISLTEFASMTGKTVQSLKKRNPDKDGNLMHSALHEACIKIKKKGVSVEHIDGSFYEAIFIPSIKYDAKADVIFMSTTEDMASQMLSLGQKFISKGYSLIDLRLYLSLDSIMSKRILEWASRFKDMDKNYQITVEELCKCFEIDRYSYANTTSFKKTVLQQPIQEIIRKSDGLWSIEEGSKHGFTLGPHAHPHDIIEFRLTYTPPPEVIKYEKLVVQTNDETSIVETILTTPKSERDTPLFKSLCNAYGMMAKTNKRKHSKKLKEIITAVTGTDYFENEK